MATAFTNFDVAPPPPFAGTPEGRLADTASFAPQARPAIARWRSAPPVLVSGCAWLREPERRDADALCRALNASELDPFLPEVPPTSEDFERFITWVRAERVQGRFAAFVVGQCGDDRAAGLFEVWPLDRERGVAEWGFALGYSHWGTGLFIDAAPLLIDFVFDRLGMTQLEARSPAQNQRGNGALRKLGARRRSGQGLDQDGQCVWVIDAQRWRAQRRGYLRSDPVGPAESGR